MQAKKSLGQNFLNSRAIVEEIVDIAALSSHDIVLEIGPGKGVLTERLLSVAREVIAVEKDDRLIFFLKLKFKNEIATGKLKLIHEDALLFDPIVVGLQPNGYKIVANIPYYITGEFIRRFLSVVAAPSRMVLMVQKEVAERIVAMDGKESILSLSVKAFGTPEYIKTVARSHFSPEPHVDSALIRIQNISKQFFSDIEESAFFRIVKKGFSAKRKQLLGNLSGKDAYLKQSFAAAFTSAAISPKARAENLSLSQWKHLTNCAVSK